MIGNGWPGRLVEKSDGKSRSITTNGNRRFSTGLDLSRINLAKIQQRPPRSRVFCRRAAATRPGVLRLTKNATTLSSDRVLMIKFQMPGLWQFQLPAFGFAGLGVGGPFAMIGLFHLVMRFCHVNILIRKAGDFGKLYQVPSTSASAARSTIFYYTGWPRSGNAKLPPGPAKWAGIDSGRPGPAGHRPC